MILMQNLKILNTRDVKHILEKLEAQFGYTKERGELDFIFLMNKDNRIYLLSKDVGQIDIETLRIDSMGMYFGELYNESVRLSIEGAQIIAKDATKGIVYIDRDQMLSWIKGSDIPFDENPGNSFIIVAYHDEITGKDDILGCGKYKDGKIMNYVSKSRKLVVVNE